MLARGLDAPLSDAELMRRYEAQQRARGTGWSATAVGVPVVREPDWPIRLTLPWSVLVSDNKKFRASMKGEKPIMVIAAEYKLAGERIEALARDRMVGAAVAVPLRLDARVWMPDARPHDLTNFCKGVHDALEGIVYTNDCWLHEVIWVRAGVDVDAPRAEIALTPLASRGP